jgi:hypothetical protein
MLAVESTEKTFAKQIFGNRVFYHFALHQRSFPGVIWRRRGPG